MGDILLISGRPGVGKTTLIRRLADALGNRAGGFYTEEIRESGDRTGFRLVTAAGLGFIGFGAQPPTPEWGLMISEGRNYITAEWWVSTFPGLAISLVVLGFNLLGDGIRDVLDPRMRGAR